MTIKTKTVASATKSNYIDAIPYRLWELRAGQHSQVLKDGDDKKLKDINSIFYFNNGRYIG